MRFSIQKMGDDPDLTGRDFVGVSIGNDSELHISVPYGIDIPEIVDSSNIEEMRFLRTYVKVIQRVLESSLVKNDIDDNSAGMESPIAAVKMIYDYITYGRIIDSTLEERITRTEKMWVNRTIQKEEPILIQDEFVYDSYITQHKRLDNENFVAIVQGNVIDHFMKHGGEILFGSKLHVPVKKIKLDSVTVYKLRRELTQSFNTRRQRVIRWAIEYIRGLRFLNTSDKNGKWYYSIIASTLWEKMVQDVYGNQYPVDKTKYGKKYYYQIINSGNIVESKHATEHDAIYEDDDQIFIIDAKMYGKYSNLLTEDVLGKQFGYYDEAKKKEPRKRIVNILFMPTDRSGFEGFDERVIFDPDFDYRSDPNRIIFLYKCSANGLIFDYYYFRKRYLDLVKSFEEFILLPSTNEYFRKRGIVY